MVDGPALVVTALTSTTLPEPPSSDDYLTGNRLARESERILAT